MNPTKKHKIRPAFTNLICQFLPICQLLSINLKSAPTIAPPLTSRKKEEGEYDKIYVYYKDIIRLTVFWKN